MLHIGFYEENITKRNKNINKEIFMSILLLLESKTAMSSDPE
jgi:hypothetical protein